MDTDEALAFLRRHQPLPSDLDLDEATATGFDEARRALELDPRPDGLALLLDAVTEGSGFGTFQLLDGTLAMYPRDAVVSALVERIERGPSAARTWFLEFALDVPDERLVDPVLGALSDPDRDARFFAATYLTDHAVEDDHVSRALRRAAEIESDPELASFLKTGRADHD